MANILEINNITKNYGKIDALNSISFKLEEGKIYGLLGRNGAGKTTLLNLITSKFEATSGDINYLGENVWESSEVQSKIYYMTEKNMFPKEFKVKQLFKTASMFYENFDMEYALNLSKKFKINTDKKFKTLSKGFESICKIIIALASNCPLVVMDEPALGLDAAVRDEFYKVFLENISATPRTFVISTHLIEEISDIIEEAIIIKNGKLLMKNPVEEILEMGYCVAGKSENVDRYSSGKKVINQESVGKFKTVTIFEPRDQRDEQKATEYEVEINPIQLQKLFVHLTNE